MKGKILFTLTFGFVIGGVAYAHTPFLVSPSDVSDWTVVENPGVSKSFYGELTGFPHTYVIEIDETLDLFARILVPDIEKAQENVSGIIVRNSEEEGRVVEIARLRAADAYWESEYEFFGGDSYRNGPEYRATVDHGFYRIEVSTPDNVGKYVLVVGTKEEREIGYFETLRRIAAIKTFFGKSELMVIQSPFVYVPLALFIGIFVSIRLWLRRRTV